MSKTLDYIREEYKRLKDEYYKQENAFQRDYINGKIRYYDYVGFRRKEWC